MQAKVIKAQRRKTNCDVEPRREGERERERKCALSSCRLSTSLSPAAHTHAEITAHTKKKSRKQLTKHDLPVSLQLFWFFFSADFLRLFLFLLRFSFLLPALPSVYGQVEEYWWLIPAKELLFSKYSAKFCVAQGGTIRTTAQLPTDWARQCEPTVMPTEVGTSRRSAASIVVVVISCNGREQQCGRAT